MARGNTVIDIDIDPFAERAHRRRVLMRIGVPILGVALTIAAILVIAVYANRADRRGALELADEVLRVTDSHIAEQVTSYFTIPMRALAEAESLAESEPVGEPRRALIEKFSIGAMKHVPQIADFLIGDPEGNFMMIRRTEAGAIDTKLVQNAPGPRKVIWIRRDATGAEIKREVDPSDTYDPRTRPWYSGAIAASGMFWTDVYVFYTGNQPGLTASTRYLSPEGETFVVGVDITLADLSAFLAGLTIGNSGRAMIVTDHGRIIAHPRADQIMKHDGAGPLTARVDEIDDAAAAGAFDRFRVNGTGRRTITVGGKRYLTSTTALQGIGHDWLILIVASENDFIAYVSRNSRISLIMSLAIVALAALTATLLVRQGLRADRAARLALDGGRAIARQSEMFQRLADDPELFDASQDHAPSALTESAVDVTGARRAILWYLLPDGQTLRCADSFQREASVHAGDFELHRDELPRFFDKLISGEEVDIADASIDPDSAEVYRLWLAPFGSRSLSLFPVRRQDHLVGVIWLEDPAQLTGSRQFLRVLASVAALRADERAKEATPLEPLGVATAIAEPSEVRSRSADLALRGLDADALGKQLYHQVSVLVFRLDDPAAAKDGARSPELVNAVVCAVQEVAAEQGIPYLKVVGSEIIGAAGFSPSDQSAPMRIANTAIASRDRASKLFEAKGLAPQFRLGIDCGIAIGSEVGSIPCLFNLWGEAVDNAKAITSSALPGSIQASEAAYLRLWQGFRFRPRGTFFLQAVGASQTFTLAGRL